MDLSRRRVSPTALPAVAVLALASSAFAQGRADSIQRVERQLRTLDQQFRLSIPAGQPVEERAFIDAGASVRFGWYSIDDEFSNGHQLTQTDARLYVLAEFDGAHRFYGRLTFEYNDWHKGDSFDGRGDVLEYPYGDEYWYQFDLRSLERAQTGVTPDYNVNFRVGRQYVHWASGVSLSLQLYALLADIELGDWGLVGLAAFTPDHTIDFDGSRPGFDDDTQRQFYGGMIEYRALPNHRPFVYILAQVDDNNQNFEDFVSGADTFPTEFEYNSYYFGVGSFGSIGTNLAYSIEAVYEAGRGKSNTFDPDTLDPIDQTTEDIAAWAVTAGVTWLFNDPNDTRLDFEVIAGSGDDDRVDSADTFGGNQPGTDDNSFNGFGFPNTGLALGPEPANLLSLRLGVGTTPFSHVDWLRDFRFRVDGFLFSKLDSGAPVNVETTNGSFMGGELDFSIDWQISSDVSASLRYAVFFPSDVFPQGQDDLRDFFYAGVTYEF